MKTQATLPDIKDKQLEILNLLYKFRYLNRPQIQKMLNHKYYNNIQLWLNDLTNKKYIIKDYNKKFAATPAVYFLDKLSIQKLRDIDGIKQTELSRIYRERDNSKKFRYHKLFIADIYLSLLDLVKQSKAKLYFYSKADIKGMKNMITPEPDAYFAIEDSNKNNDRYFLDVIKYPAPKAELEIRAKQYFDYCESEVWQKSTKHPFPKIIVVCPDYRSRNNLIKKVKELLNRSWVEISFFYSTWDEIRNKGVNKSSLHRITKE